MIREYIVILSAKQEKALIEKAQAAGNDDDLAHLQMMINKWLEDDSKRLEHKEK